MSKEIKINSVAVIIAAYNAEKTISRAVESALRQDHVTQVFVVDDASQDDTYNTALQSDDDSNRLSVLRLPQNSGPSAARNLALESLNTEWMTVLDADDYMDDGRISELLKKVDDSCDILADDLILINEHAPDEGSTPMLGLPKLETYNTLTLTDFVEGNIPSEDEQRRELGFLKPIIRSKLIRENKLSYNENMRLGEDYDLYVRLLASGAKAGLTNTCGYVAVRRYDSLSGQHGHIELENLYKSTKDHQHLDNLTSDQKSALHKSRNHVSRKYRWAKMIHDKKNGNLFGFLSCFLTSPNNMMFLLSNAIESLIDRSKKNKLAKESN